MNETVRRRTRGAAKLIAALVVVACVAAACSSASPPPASGSKGKGTPAQVLTANALNLKSSDFPASWTTESSSDGPNVVRLSLNACAQSISGSASPATSAVSKDFLDQSTGQEVGSQVQVFDTADQANSTAKNAASGATSGCMQTQVKAGLQKTISTSVTLQDVIVKSVPPVGTGSHAFNQEVEAVVNYLGKKEQQQTAYIYVEVEGFTSSTQLVEAEFENTGTPPSKDLVAKTMATLTARAGGK